MMNLFLHFEQRKIIDYFKTKTLAKVITMLLFFLVFFFVGAGIYFFFVSGFRYVAIEATDDIRLGLTLFLYEIFLLVLSGIIFLSSLVSTLFNLFKSQNNAWIIASPSYNLFPKIVFTKSLFSSILPLFVMFLPMMLAFNRVHHFQIESFFTVLLSVFLLMVIVSSVATVFVMGVTFFYHQISKLLKAIPFSFKGLVSFVIFLLVSFMIWLWQTLKTLDIVALLKAQDADSNLSTSVIDAYFSFSPAHFLSKQLLAWQEKNSSEALLYFSFFILLTSFIFVVAWYSMKLFYPFWLKFQEGGSTQGLHSKKGLLFLFSGTPTMALFKKEALIYGRDMKGLIWFLFLLSLWVIEIGMSTVMGYNMRRYGVSFEEKKLIIQALQFIVAVYFIASFSLRFVYPSFSLEKKTSWITRTAPISFKKIFLGKFFFFVSFFTLLGFLMSCINSFVFSLSLVTIFSFVGLLVSVIIFIVTLALCFGVFFPNKETDDPEVMTTSMPGLFFTALALLYGGLSGWLLYFSLVHNKEFYVPVFVVFTIFVTITLFTFSLKKARPITF